MDPPPRKPVHLKPPPTTSTSTSQPRTPTSSTSPSPIPRAPVTAHSSATIAETAVFQGHHPITIGAGTVIHPRTRIYSYDGPVVIGEKCIIGEKTTIGVVASTASALSTAGSMLGEEGGKEGLQTRLSGSVTTGPFVTILPGARVHEAVTIEALAVLNRGVVVGAHSKVCGGCEVAEGVGIGEWMVVWGVGGRQRRRRRATGKMSSAVAVAQGGQTLEGRVIEDARLMVLHKEREALVRLIGAGAGGRRR